MTSGDPGTTVRVERHRGVVHVVLARPERHNALVPEMWQALARIGDELRADSTVTVVIVRGEGPSFCRGLDARALGGGVLTPFDMTGDEADRGREHYVGADVAAAQATGRWLVEADFVSIAAVRGLALGAGAQLAMSCDLRVVGDNATFALPEVDMGIFPEMGAVAVLPGIVGYAKALELGLTAARVDADEALRIGLANRVVPAPEVDDVSVALAERIARARPEAIRTCKRAMRRGADGDLDGAYRVAREGAVVLLDDIAAWQERRRG